MRKLRGIAASPGIVIGQAYVCTEEKLSIPRYDIRADEVPHELARFRQAVRRATQELEELKSRVQESAPATDEKLLDSHLMMINDPEFSALVEDGLKKELKNAEWVIISVIEEMTDRLLSVKDDYLSERSSDFNDIARQIINHLLERSRKTLEDIREDSVLIAHNLMPSDTISLAGRKVLGIATEMGGKTSHTAIIARSLEIPAVLGLSHLTWHVSDGDEVIVDGNTGAVIVNPDRNLRERYEKKKKRWDQHELELLELGDLPAQTTDGHKILLEANIEIPEEIQSVKAHGADGIGLYRSEFLYIKPHAYPPEEVQFAAYRQVLQGMQGRPVTIRTLDLGGDKTIPGFKDTYEDNPILGWRAVRFCLAQPDIFKTQLRALIRSSVHGNLKIMFPMISGPEELDKILGYVEAVKEELTAQGLDFKCDIPLGIMIEVPSAALTSDVLARKVDFFSIGTNDLIQYLIAVDRGNERIAYLYEPLHLAVLRTIRLVIENAHSSGIPVGMCGEMAADPRMAGILLGLGLDSLSMSAASIPEIKSIVRSIKIQDAKHLTERIMQMTSADEIARTLDSWMSKRVAAQISI
jgi:phosphotransferase system enzyme I (PtsI)